MGRGDLSDAEGELIGAPLPSERGCWVRTAGDNRRMLNSILSVLRIARPWRDMHERYGKRNSVYVRFRRWAEQGAWDALLQTLVDLGLADDWQHMIDSTSVRATSRQRAEKHAAAAERMAPTPPIRHRLNRMAKPSGHRERPSHVWCGSDLIAFLMSGGGDVGSGWFSDLPDRYAALSTAGDPLERLAAVVDLELFSGLLVAERRSGAKKQTTRGQHKLASHRAEANITTLPPMSARKQPLH